MAPHATLAHLILRDVVSDTVAGVNGAVADVNGVKHTVSSWDSCMAESYCKYPVIIGIIVAVLIAASIAWCIIRCCCCGLQCCCSCFSCFNACCPGPRRREKADRSGMARVYSNPHQHIPPYFAQQPTFTGAQTATFDSSGYKKNKAGGLHEDALPHMPSWDTATEKRVEDESPDQTEMSNLDTGAAGASNQQKQGLLAPSAGSQRQHEPYTSGQGAANDYYNGPQPPRAYSTSPAPGQQYGARQQYPASPAHSTAPSAAGYFGQQRQQYSTSPGPTQPLYDGHRAYSTSPGPTPYAQSPYSAPYQPPAQNNAYHAPQYGQREDGYSAGMARQPSYGQTQGQRW